MLRRLVFLAARLKEELEEGGGIGGEDAFDYFDFMVEDIGIGELEFGADTAEAEIPGGEDKGADAGMDKRAGAHDAGFEGGVEGSVLEAVVAEIAGGGAEEVDFGVGGGVVGGDGGVMGAGDNGTADDEDGADGDFTGFGGLTGLGEGLAHEGIVDQMEPV